MSAPPQAFTLSVDDLRGKSLDEVVQRMVPALNAYLRNAAVRGEALSSENFNEDFRLIDVTVPATYPGGDFPLKVECRLAAGTKPQAAWAVSALLLDSNGKPSDDRAAPVSGVWLDWVPVDAKTIRIRSISGLSAASRYRVGVIIRGT